MVTNGDKKTVVSSSQFWYSVESTDKETYMKKIFCTLSILTGALFATPSLMADECLKMQLKDGDVYINLREDLAPLHVKQITELTQQEFYDGIIFHRVIDGFMAQTGDPTGTGMGGSDLNNIPAEFTTEPFTRGVVAMARSQDPDSANSQFFICFDSAPHLNHQYTVFGKVIKGMEHVDNIKRGDEDNNGKVTDPDSIIKMTVAKCPSKEG